MAKKLVLLLGAFALFGCGEKEKSPNSVQTGQGAATVQEAKEEVEAVLSGPEPLISDADVARFAKDAFDMEMETVSPPAGYTGWTAWYFDKAKTQLAELTQMKNGKPDGPTMLFYNTGKIMDMSVWKSGKIVSRQAFYPTGKKMVTTSPAVAGGLELLGWHKNGKKAAKILMKDGAPLMKDGALVLMKFWNDEGEELNQEEGMKMTEQIVNQLRG